VIVLVLTKIVVERRISEIPVVPKPLPITEQPRLRPQGG